MSTARNVFADFKLKPAPPAGPGAPPPTGTTPPTTQPQPQPRLTISHRTTRVVNGRVAVKLTCARATCKGTLTFETTSRSSRNPRTAAAGGSAKFNVAAGRSTTVKIKPSAALRKLLRTKGRAVVKVTGRLDGLSAAAAPTKQLTILPEKRKKK